MNQEKYDDYSTLLQTLAKCTVEAQRLSEKYSDEMTDAAQRVHEITEAYAEEVELIAVELEAFFNQSEVARLKAEVETQQVHATKAQRYIAELLQQNRQLIADLEHVKRSGHISYGRSNKYGDQDTF